GAIVALLALNLVFLLLVNLRWWLLLRALGWKIPLLSLVIYRLAGFGVNYFTPGPQIGGEPLQVHLLYSRHGVFLEDAITSVFFDRIVDGLANFSFLFGGCLIVIASGLLDGILPAGVWLLAFPLLLFPAGYLLALRFGKQPATRLVNRLRWAPVEGVRGMISRSEAQVARLIREKPVILVVMIAISILAWAGVFLEFWLCLHFLGTQASLTESVSMLTVARFAFLVPVPGGLGALEAGQLIAAQMLGWGAAVGIAVSLLIRTRDSFFALLGLGLGAVSYRSFFLPKKDPNERR
ncbi:MAG: flippase-like domain-containing protein, partial [Anaerolineaceae bacterium]|nr:flippase-like domain-containing protein [Anaerolineaceae bacterium]